MFDNWGTGEWTFAIFILVQFGGVVFMFATMRQEIKDLENRVKTLESHKVGERLAVIEAGVKRISDWVTKQDSR